MKFILTFENKLFISQELTGSMYSRSKSKGHSMIECSFDQDGAGWRGYLKISEGDEVYIGTGSILRLFCP